MNSTVCILYCVNESFIINLNENDNKAKSMVHKMLIKILNRNKYFKRKFEFFDSIYMYMYMNMTFNV